MIKTKTWLPWDDTEYIRRQIVLSNVPSIKSVVFTSSTIIISTERIQLTIEHAQI